MNEPTRERSSTRQAFSRSTRNEALSSRDRSVSLADASRIVRYADDAKERITHGHRKVEGKKVTERYGDLLAKHGLGPAPAPDGSTSDQQASLMARARKAVQGELANKIGRIDRAQARMMKSGIIRDRGNSSRSIGLGE